MITNADKILFRCSSLGHIMPKEKAKVEFTDTCLTHLIDVFVSAKYKRREEIQSKYLFKGNRREEDAITILSRKDKLFYTKNDRRLSNEFITGECDLYIGDDIEAAEETLDTKCSWSAHTFFRSQRDLNPMYEWQGHGYMALTGAKQHTIAYCLVNGTVEAIMAERRKLMWSMFLNESECESNLTFIEKAKQIEINHIFDIQAFIAENPHFQFNCDIAEWHYDIPMSERVFKYIVKRDDVKIQAIYDRVVACRQWINNNLFINDVKI